MYLLNKWNMQLFMALVIFTLAGCGGSVGSVGENVSQNISVNGAVQKGPFIVGTPVYVNKLNINGDASESTIITEVKDSIGSFSFQTKDIGPVQVVATGYYFSELTGQISKSMLTLKSIYEVSDQSNQQAQVNILTHLINDRVLLLMKSGSKVCDAISQAQKELVAALNPVLQIENIPSFSALNIYNINSDNKIGNAYLLALSTTFYKYAELKAEGKNTSADAQLSLILNQIAKDFATDGVIDLQGFIEDITSALRQLNPKAISDNLKNRSKLDFSQPIEVPDITMFFGLCAGDQDCAWSVRSPMPLATRGHSSAVYQERIFVFGGTSSYSGNQTFDSVFMYDPATNQWAPKAPMPVGLYDSKAHTVGDKIYVFGGYGIGGFINAVQEYDPVNDSWSMKNPMPTYRYIFMSEVVNGKVYVIGGQGTIDDGPWVSKKPWEYKDHVEIYNPQTDSWSTGKSAPVVLAGGASGTMDGKIYIFGGDTGSIQSNNYIYDTVSDSWVQKSSSPIKRNGHTCVAIGDKFILMGGRNYQISQPEQLDKIEIYSPSLDTWQEFSYLPTARYWFSAALVDGLIHIFGGVGGSGNNTFLESQEVFDASYLPN